MEDKDERAAIAWTFDGFVRADRDLVAIASRYCTFFNNQSVAVGKVLGVDSFLGLVQKNCVFSTSLILMRVLNWPRM